MILIEIKIVDLFSGIGGFRHGIENAVSKQVRDCGSEQNLQNRRNSTNPERRQVTCVLLADIDKYATAVYNYNFKENWKPTDITKLKSEDIPDHDILCGGFPCVSFSIAGKRLGFKDTRGTLFFEIARIAKVKQPRFLFLENVKGLLSHDNGRTFARILATLDEIGYDAEWECINSRYFGVPQNRERVFIIGYLRGQRSRQVFPLGQDGGKVNSTKRVREQVSNTLRTNYSNGHSNETYVLEVPEIAGTLTGGGHSGGLHSDMTAIPVINQLNENKESGGKQPYQQNRIYDSEGILPALQAQLPKGNCIQLEDIQPKIVQRAPLKFLDRNQKNCDKGDYAFTIDSCNTGGVSIDSRIRRLTPTECMRLQGFPDSWCDYGFIDGKVVEISDTQKYKMAGNSVTTNVIEAISRELFKNEEFK